MAAAHATRRRANGLKAARYRMLLALRAEEVMTRPHRSWLRQSLAAMSAR